MEPDGHTPSAAQDHEPHPVESTSRMPLMRIALAAYRFWETTDDHPLIGLTPEQGFLWDVLCEELSRV